MQSGERRRDRGVAIALHEPGECGGPISQSRSVVAPDALEARPERVEGLRHVREVCVAVHPVANGDPRVLFLGGPRKGLLKETLFVRHRRFVVDSVWAVHCAELVEVSLFGRCQGPGLIFPSSPIRVRRRFRQVIDEMVKVRESMCVAVDGHGRLGAIADARRAVAEGLSEGDRGSSVAVGLPSGPRAATRCVRPRLRRQGPAGSRRR